MPNNSAKDILNKEHRWLNASRIAMIYALVGILWIFTSDWLLFRLIGTTEDQLFGAIFKGTFYVVATGYLLYWLVRSMNRGLEKSEELFRRTFEETASGMAHQSLNGRFLRVNHKLCEITGYSREELLEKTFQEITHPEDLPQNLINSQKLIKGEIDHYRVEKRYIRKDGSLVWADVSVSVLHDSSGAPLHFIIVVEDITGHKTMLERIEHLNSEMAAVRDINQLITKESDLKHLIGNACRILVSVPAFESARLVLLDQSCSPIDEAYAGKVDDRIKSAFEDHRIKSILYGNTGSALASNGSPTSPGIVESSANVVLHPYSDHSFAITALLQFSGRLHGILGVITSKNYPYAVQGVSLLQEIAEDVGFALSKIEIQKALGESEEKFRIFADATYDWENWLAPDGRHIYVSPSCERITGYPPQAFYDDPLLLQKIIYKDDYEEYELHKKDVLDTAQEKCAATFRIVSKNGDVRWIGHVCQSVIDKDGQYLGRRGSNRDITAEKLSETALRESQRRYHDLFNAMSDAISLHEMNPDGPGKFIDVNEEACRRLQYTKEEFLEMTPLDINSFDFDPREMIGMLFKNGKVTFVSNHLPKDKKAIPVEVASSLFDWNGQTVVLSVARDISERIQAENQILQNKELLETILENIPVMVAFFDHEMHMTWVNRQLQQTLGLSLEEAKGCDMFEICYPDEEYGKNAIQSISSANSEWKDFKTRRRNGTILDITWANVLLSNGTTVGIGLDITERKKAEQNLLRLYTAIEQLPDLVMIAGQQGIVEYVNPAFERITGYSRDEIIGKTPKFMSSENENLNEINTAIMENLLKGTSWSGIMKNNTKDGRLYYQDTTMAPVFGSNNVPIAYVGIGRDVTLDVMREASMRQSQKLEAIGALAGGIAHDFNNILHGILGYTQLVYDSLGEEHKERRLLGEVLSAVERAAGLVKQILTFSRQAEQEPRPLRLHLIIKEALKLIRGSLPSNIRIEEKINANCGPILADPVQMHQVIMNLSTNAWHAMRERGGIMSISLSEIVIDDTMSFDLGTIKPGNAILLTVSDTGCGMDAQTLQRIFEPYFTTKEKVGGTGLGLATVHGIIINHKGAISVQSKPGKGSVFKIFLPQIEMEVSEDTRKQDSPTAALGKGRVLVVDDEVKLLEVTKRALSDIGFEVTAADSGDEAFRLFMSDPEKFDILLTDMTMPGMLGSQLSLQVKAIRPELPVLMLTGFSDLLDEDLLKICGINKVMMKPVRIFELVKTIMALIESGEQEKNL